ncbi:Oligo-1,6-glucosidase [Paenibacillus sp. GM1FR]|nr:Oligo-1,6-glucosidase [Paenibacillus sp. GM1FR]
MTNVAYPSIEDYNDIADRNLYQIKREEGMSHEEIINIIWVSSRDNSRTPMQWSSAKEAGFTSGTPWLKVNDNYVHINVEKQLQEPGSILHFYKQMIQLRKEHDTLTYGIYELLMPDHPSVYAYTRTLADQQVLVVINLSEDIVQLGEEELGLNFSEIWLTNYENGLLPLVLRPFETIVGLSDIVK